MDETLDKLGETIAGALQGSVVSHRVEHGELTVGAVAVGRIIDATEVDQLFKAGIGVIAQDAHR